MTPKTFFSVNLGEDLKKLLSHLKSAPFNLSNVKFHVKEKTNWPQKCLIWAFLD